MKTLATIILLFLPLVTKAQQSFDQEDSTDEHAFQQLIGRNYIDKSLIHKGIFFRSAYLPGKVVFQSGDSIEKIYLRYSSLEDKLLWLNKYFEIRNSDTVFSFKKFIIKALNDTIEKFYQVYFSRGISLLALRKVAKASSYMKKKQYFVYAPSPVFVILIKDKEYVLKILKIKNLYKLFPEKKESISREYRQNPGPVKTEKEFVRFISQIEPILAE
jgi:hypothetical protein